MGQSLFSFGWLDPTVVLLPTRPPTILAKPALVTVAAQTILDQFFRSAVRTLHVPHFNPAVDNINTYLAIPAVRVEHTEDGVNS